ncbi:MAG: DUF6444 domain-containing protein, partial [Cyanobacteria bacterium J06621_11]
ALIRLLWENYQAMSQRVEALNQRIKALEKRPKKTSQNSSKPPAQRFKLNKPSKRKIVSGEQRALAVQGAAFAASPSPSIGERSSAKLSRLPNDDTDYLTVAA